jgi:CIC family chloride channel protein
LTSPGCPVSVTCARKHMSPDNLESGAFERRTDNRSAALARFQDAAHAFKRRLRISETAWLFTLAAIGGALAGLGSIAFHFMIAGVQWLAFGSADRAGPLAAVTGSGYPAWRMVLAPALGGLVVGPLIWRFAREAQGHGVPAVVRAIHERAGKIGPLVAIVKTVASAITLGSGGSLGREGPVVQIGGSIGSSVGQAIGVTPRQLRMLAAGGAAAGLAAIFNAPLGGAFFALEVILGSFAMDAFGPVVVASVAATVVSRGLMGDAPVIAVPAYRLEHFWELAIYAVVGVACGAVGVLLTRGVALGVAVFERVRVPEWAKPALGGLAVGVIALLWTPRILGNGYETVDTLISSQEVEGLLLLVLAAKLIATCLALGSGGSGGLFGPSLFLGAVVGAFVGKFAALILPVAPRGAYALVGMGALVAGATHAPVSMVLMLFEMTQDYKIVLPLLIATSVASSVAKRLYAESIDTVLDARKGRAVHRGLEEMALHATRVIEVARSADRAVVPATAPLAALLDRFLASHSEVLPVIDPKTRAYLGAVLLEDVRSMNEELRGTPTSVIAYDLLRRDLPVLSPDAPLTQAIEAFHGLTCDALPVVGTDGRLLGLLGDSEIVSAYRTQVLRSELRTAVFLGDAGKKGPERVELPAGISLGTVAAPGWLTGQTLAEKDIRRRYGLLVLSVGTRAPDGKLVKRLPDPHTPIVEGELLEVLGPTVAVDAIARGEEPPLATREDAEAVTSASQRMEARNAT